MLKAVRQQGAFALLVAGFLVFAIFRLQGPSTGTAANPGTIRTASTGSGAGSYLAGTGQSSNLDFPLVRTDNGNDTILHVTSASAGKVTINFYNGDGSLDKTTQQQLPAGGSADVYASGIVGGNFVGTAEVSGTSIAASAEIASPANVPSGNDNLDTYAGRDQPLKQGFFPIDLNDFSFSSGLIYSSTVYLENPGSSTANATVTFWSSGSVQGTPVTYSIPPHGQAQANPPGNNYIGPVQVASDNPVVGIADVRGNVYGLTSMVATAESTIYVPHFEYAGPNNSDQASWNSNLVVLNTSQSSSATFTVTFYNPDGSVAGTLSNQSADKMRTWAVGDLCSPTIVRPQQANLPVPFNGSAVVTAQSGGPLAVGILRARGTFGCVFGAPQSFNLTAIADYAPPSGAPSGSVIPGVSNNANNASTAFTVMNPNSTAQGYQITYLDSNGSTKEKSSISLNPNGTAYFDQSTDGNLPNGFSGSATIANSTGGSAPIVVADLYGSPPPAPTPTPVNGCPSSSASASSAAQSRNVTDVSGSNKVYLPFVSNGACTG